MTEATYRPYGSPAFRKTTERTMGSDCPDCKGTGYVQPKFVSNDGNVSAGQIVKVPCPNPNCATRKRQDILGAKEFFALQRKDIVIGRVKATISAVPPMRKKEELGTTVTLTNVKAKELTDHIFEAAHQSLRSEYRDMYIASIECDGNLYNFKGVERPASGHLSTEIVTPQGKPAMPTPTNELPTDASVDVVMSNPPSPEPAALSKSDASARWIIADLDKYSVWGDWLTVVDWLKAHDMTLETYNDDIQKAIIEDFKAELRVELERGGLKAVQATIFSLFGVNKIEDALHTFSPDDIRKKVAHRVNEEIKLKQQQENAVEGQRRIVGNQNAPLTNIIPPDNTTQSVAVPRPNPNAVVFGTGDTSFDLMISKAEIMLKSGFLPPSFKTVQQVITVCMMGEALGLPMIVAVNMINVINNRLSISSQGMIALTRKAGLLDSLEITDDGRTCTVTVKRKGEPIPYTDTFSMDEADQMMTTEWVNGEKKTIKLSQKSNWIQQPKTMRKWRCVSKVWKVVFGDVNWGLITSEEAETLDDTDPKVTVERVAA